MTDYATVPMEDRVIQREVDPSPWAFRLEPSPRWVRVVLGGITVADSKRVMLLHESKHMPVYYFPVADVRMDLLMPSGRAQTFPEKGTATYYTITTPHKTAEHGAWIYHDPPGAQAAGLRGMVAFYWSKMDAWYEEDDEVYVHPRDPYHRVDTVHSSRHVRVVVLGETVAETRRPRLLFETTLPTRFYIPKQDVRMDLLVPSTTQTHCPYKGVASHWSVRIGDTLAKDMAWTYKYPLPECPKIENLVAFYNERVDAIFVDGEEIEKPKTPWTRRPQLIKLVDGAVPS